MASQTEIYEQLQSVLGSNEIPPFDNNSSQVENLSFIEFLFEIVQQTTGQDQFKNIVFNSVMSELKDSASIDDIIVNKFRDNIFCNLNFIIPEDLTTRTVNGIFVDRSEIDAFNLFKTDPDSDVGRLMYEGNDEDIHLNYMLKQAFNSSRDNPLSWNYQNTELFNVYNQGDGLLFRFGESYANQSFNTWAEDFFASTQIFNSVNFVTLLVDILTGAVSIEGNKTRNEVRNESRLIQALKKLFGFCSDEGDDNQINTSPQETLRQNQNSNFNNDNNINDNSKKDSDFPLNFDSDDLNDIDNEQRLLNDNLLQFKTCGNIELPLNSEKVINDLKGIFQNFDGNNVDNNNSSVNINDASNFFENTVKNGAQNKLNAGDPSAQDDLTNIQAEFHLSILKAIPYALMKMILGPKVLLFAKVANVIQNNNNNSLTIDDILKKLKNVVGQIGSAITKIILDTVFNFLKKELEKIVSTLVNRFLKQRLLDYASILGFLKSLIGALSSDSNNCSSILTTILRILSLANFSPAPVVPPPLVLGAVPLKPGMNEVTAINDMKADMASKGLNTSSTYSDGTPNYVMFALESAVSAVIKNIKQYSKVDVTTIGPTGPTQGSGQIQ